MKLMFISSAIYMVSGMFLGMTSLAFWGSKNTEPVKEPVLRENDPSLSEVSEVIPA